MIYNRIKKVMVSAIVIASIIAGVNGIFTNFYNKQIKKVQAAGKTVEGFKTTEYDGSSDAKVFFDSRNGASYDELVNLLADYDIYALRKLFSDKSPAKDEEKEKAVEELKTNIPQLIIY